LIVIGGFLLGAVIGAATALRRGGRKLDALQYGAGYAIAFTLAGLFLTILLERVLAG
jgi:hypothetical protein